MNGNYYNTYPNNELNNNNQLSQQTPSYQNQYNNSYEEQLFIENVLKSNKGKKAKIQVTIPGSTKWQDNTFEGIIENTGKDHIIISNPTTGEWNLIPIIYIDFITFEEPLNYSSRFYI